MCRTIRKKAEEDIKNFIKRLVESTIKKRGSYMNTKRTIKIVKKQEISLTEDISVRIGIK